MGNANTVQRRQETLNPQETPDQNHDRPANPNQETKEIEQESYSSFTCEICIEPMPPSNKFNNTDRCVHPFCTDCMSKYIQVKVEDDSTSAIQCPGLNCQELLDPISCRSMVAQEVFVKWCDNLCESALLGFDRCYCPHQNCSALVLNECGEIDGSSKCPNCKNLFCYQCKMVWHAGFRCDESQELRDGNDVLFGQLLEKENWTRCPGCGHSIERIAGCRIVTCRCKTSFCYHCGAKRGYFHSCPKYQSNKAPEGNCERVFVFVLMVVFLLLFGIPLFLFYIIRDIERGVRGKTKKSSRKSLQQPKKEPNTSPRV